MSSAFIFRAKEVNHTLVYLNAGVDSALLEQLSERSATAGLLVESLVEKDNTGDVIIESGISGEQKLKRKEKYGKFTNRNFKQECVIVFCGLG